MSFLSFSVGTASAVVVMVVTGGSVVLPTVVPPSVEIFSVCGSGGAFLWYSGGGLAGSADSALLPCGVGLARADASSTLSRGDAVGDDAVLDAMLGDVDNVLDGVTLRLFAPPGDLFDAFLDFGEGGGVGGAAPDWSFSGR